jgi:signal transduction histidine kinase
MPSVQAVDRTVRSFVHSLAGMRERAALYGGTATAGPGYEGGWTVTATIPVLKRGAR